MILCALEKEAPQSDTNNPTRSQIEARISTSFDHVSLEASKIRKI